MAAYLMSGSRPPFVTFEERSVEDRAATVASGCYKAKSVDYVIIQLSGSKDCVEKEALPWLADLPKNPNMQPEWVERYKAMYKAFKEGREPTPNGIHVRSWPAIDKGQADTLIGAQVLTVEDLAAANEQTLTRIGMGARGLQQKARAWLESADKNGKSAEELTALREKSAQQDQQIAELRKQLSALLNKQEAESPKPPADDFL